MEEDKFISDMLERTLLFYDRKTVESIRNTTFAISGLGGVGAITAELLARWGVRKFRLFDKDKYDPSNLNRQLFATSKTLGDYKVDIAADRVKQINPYAEIEMKIKDSVDNQNVHPFISGAGIIIQSADSPSCRLFYLAAQQHKVPAVTGYSTIIGCRVQVYDYSNSSFWFWLEKIKDNIKWRNQKNLMEMTKAELMEFDKKVMHPAMPTMNFVTNIAGAMIVCEAIKLLTKTGKVCRFPKIIDFDLYANKYRVKNLYSPFRIETIKKVFQKSKSEDLFKNIINEAKQKAGVELGQ